MARKSRNILEILLQVSGASQAKNALGGVGNAVDGLESRLNKFAGGLAFASLVAGAGKATLELAKTGAEAIAVDRTFRSLSGSATQYEANLRAMQRATRGLTDVTTQQQIANRLLGLRAVNTAGELEEFVTIARRLGGEFRGLSADAAATELAITFSNRSFERLDSFGISADRVRRRVEELKESGESLDNAFRIATFEEARETLSRLPEEVDSTTQQVEQLNAEWNEWLSALGVAIERNRELSGLIGELGSGAQLARVNIFGGTALEELQAAETQLESLIGRREALINNPVISFFASSGELESLNAQIAETEATIARLNSEQAQLTEQADAEAAERKRIADEEARAADEAARRLRILQGINVFSRVQTSLDSFDFFTTRLGRAGEANQQAQLEARREQLIKEANQRVQDDQERVARESQRAQEAAAREAARAWENNFSRIEGVVSGVLGQGLNALDGLGLNFLETDVSREIGEDARRLAAIAVGDFNGQAAQLLSQSNPELFRRVMEAEDPAGLAQQILQDFQLGIGAGAILDKEAAKARVRKILFGQDELSALSEEITRDLIGEGFSPDRINAAIGQSGLLAGAGAGQQTATALVGGVNQSIPNAIQESGLGTNVLNSLESALRGKQDSYTKIAETIAEGLNEAIPAAMGTTGGVVVDAIADAITSRLGLAGARS